MKLLRLWSTRKAQHWLYVEAKKEDVWIGAFWRYERGDWWSEFNLWICVLPCLPLHYIRHTAALAGTKAER